MSSSDFGLVRINLYLKKKWSENLYGSGRVVYLAEPKLASLSSDGSVVRAP